MLYAATVLKEIISERKRFFRHHVVMNRMVSFFSMAEQIKTANEAGRKRNRAVDEAGVSGIPGEDNAAIRKKTVSSETKESVKANGLLIYSLYVVC